MAAALPPAVRPLAAHPGSSALFCDYDGTLAPIVADPAAAGPLPGAGAVLARLAERLRVVAVVSGRPASFLVDALPEARGVHLAGLYGIETVDGDGRIQVADEAEPWRSVVAQVAERAARDAPEGLGVEPKGLTVALHWRRAPTLEGWARRFAADEAATSGLVVQDARMAVELRPPVATDKGTVVRRLAEGCTVAAYVGDDVGDLPAFAVLEELAGRGVAVARVAVADAEGPGALAGAADVVVSGPLEVLALLERLADAPVGGR